jgi:hypothetical protein
MVSSTARGFLSAAEVFLSERLFGKTLLGEIVASENDCNEFAQQIRSLVEEVGPGRAIRMLADRWPLTLSVWLVNEAFFNFLSGAYWPYVLGKLGIEDTNNYSSRFGKAFLKFLRERELPEFRQLKTSWSYLGPILAHCGIPASCLPEFFEKVVPRAMEYGMGEGTGFDDLLRIVPRLYLTKPTERFLQYGGKIAEDFLQRTIEMSLFWQREQRVPDVEETRLPERVVEAFSSWVKSTPRISYGGGTRRVMRRPEIYFDPYHGLRLFLPPQKIEGDEHRFTWILVADSSDPEQVDVYAEPGERVTLPKDYFLSEPFSSLQTRLLVNGVERGSWTETGISGQTPFLFFRPDNHRLLHRKGVGAAQVGIAHLPSWRIIGHINGGHTEPEVVESFGPMPFGWNTLVASVYDLEGLDRLSFVDEQEPKAVSLELADASAFGARLVESGGRKEVAPDEFLVFWGQAPCLEIWRAPRQTEEEFLASWTVEIETTERKQDENGSIKVSLQDLRNIVDREEASLWHRIDLSCTQLLGPNPWGEYQLRARGPIGQDARFHFRVLPEMLIIRDRIDWSNISQTVKCQITVPAGARVRGAESTDDPQRYLVSTTGELARLHLDIAGYRDQLWEIPFYVHFPLPAWAVYQPNSGRQIVTWTREPLRLSVAEFEGRDAILLLKLATPRGIPSSANLSLNDPKGIVFVRDLELDARGYGRVDLAPFFAETRQRRVSRLDLVIQLQLDRLVHIVCGKLLNRWIPQGFACEVLPEEACFRWTEGVTLENRAIQVTPLLMPWETPQLFHIPDEASGEWKTCTRDIFPTPGIYRATLGQYDVWTEAFEPGAESSREIEHGTLEDWEKNPLFFDSGPDGYLFRLILSNYIGCPTENARLPVEHQEDGGVFASKILAARETLRSSDDSARVVPQLDLLLGSIPSDDVLAGIARQSGDCGAETILRARLFTRRWHPGSQAGAGNTPSLALDESDSQSLWRIWDALGMWADMHMVRYSQGAESRILQHVGLENARMFCPIQEGATMRLRSADKSIRISANIVRVDSGPDQTPFDIMRLDRGVSLELKGTSPGEFKDRLVLVERDGRGRLRFEAQDSTSLPEALEKVGEMEPSEVSWAVFYPEEAASFHGYPEPEFIGIVRMNGSRPLETIRSVIPPMPRGAVGPQAFQDACFAWCIRAASDPRYRDELADVCAANAVGLARELDQFQNLQEKEGRRTKIREWLVHRELKRRWFPNTVKEPLYGVHFLSLAVAVSLVWKGIGRVLPFAMHERMLEDLASIVNRLTPELLTYDIVMTCLLEALFLARRRRDASGPGETDQRPDGKLQQLFA